MSSPDASAFRRLALAAAMALSVAGCFRPVYGENSASAVPSKTVEGGNVAERMRSLDVKPIEGRVGLKARNELIFLLRGGAAQGPVGYRLEITKLAEAGQSGVVDPLLDIPQTRTITLTVTYRMTRAGSLDPVFTGNAFASASYFSGLQRYANIRAERDAEDRAATQIAESVAARVRGYFAAGR